MNCKDFQDQIVDLFYRETSASVFESGMQHQESCHSCGPLWTEISGVRAAFAQLSEREPAPWTISKIIAQSQLSQESVSWVAQLGAFIRNWTLAPVAVGLFAVAGLVMVINQQPASQLARVSDPALFNGVMDGIPTPTLGLQDRLSQNPFITGQASPTFGNAFAPVSFKTVALEDGDAPTGLWSAPADTPAVLKSAPQGDARYKLLMESDADALLMRGRRLKAMGRVDLALNDFDTIYQSYPDYTYIGDVLMYRAQCYAFQGQYDQAVDSLEAYLEKDPSKKALVLSMIAQINSSRTTVIQ